VVPTTVVTPLHLVDRIREAVPEASADASRVVDLYLRARFGQQPLDREEARDMKRALAGARRALG
jgi:hypothetical protein